MSPTTDTNGPGPIWTSAEGSMAQATAKTRWPKIVQGMIDDVQQTIDESKSEQQVAQGPSIIKGLQKLKDDIVGNEELHPLPDDDGSPDLAGYNSELASFGKMSWHNCPWLFAECYLYRRVHGLIAEETAWRGYDIFARQKLGALIASNTAIGELSAKYLALSASDAFTQATPETAYAFFVELTEVALWGNATDLSLLTSLSLEQIKAIQGTKAIEEGQAKIVSNDMAAAWEYISANASQRVDIVLDNSGFELFTDLLYSLYLLDSKLASTIRLHVKSMPWFVSDVNPHDITVLLSTLSDTTIFPESSQVPALAARLKTLLNKGAITVQEDPFWTTGYDFQAMPTAAPGLFNDLCQSALVVFKGDLNYRKLVRDATWPHTTPFKDALGPLAQRFGPGSSKSLKTLALRTNKADVCVGINEATLQRLDKEAPGKSWVRNGQYAVVNLCVV